MGKAFVYRIVPVLLLVFLLGAVSCSSGVSQEEFDSVRAELNQAEQEIATLRTQLNEAQTSEALYQELTLKFEQLQKANDTAQTDLKAATESNQELTAKYDDLEAEYQQLQKELAGVTSQYLVLQDRYDALAATIPTGEITADAIEQTLFSMINQIRVDEGLHELVWGEHLDGWSEQNSKEMATSGKESYSGWASWQEIFWATGYDSAEEIAQAALTVWRVATYRWDTNILVKGATYGAVGAYKSGDIWYVTYMASLYK